MTRYIKPAAPTNTFNEVVAWLTRHGVSILGSRILSVRGRKSGATRTTPVNLLRLDGDQYLVAPRGNTQWVRNLRADDFTGELRVGKKVERFRAVELSDDEKPPVLRAYLRRWRFEVGVFFDGVNAKAPEEKLREIAPGYPIFRITPADAAPGSPRP